MTSVRGRIVGGQYHLRGALDSTLLGIHKVCGWSARFYWNVVKTQIWIAISVYVLIAILKKRLSLEQSLYTILQILSVTFLEKIPIFQAFREADYKKEQGGSGNQLLLFN